MLPLVSADLSLPRPEDCLGMTNLPLSNWEGRSHLISKTKEIKFISFFPFYTKSALYDDILSILLKMIDLWQEMLINQSN